MPSPFPGMDPWIEKPSLWPDFHISLLVALRAALNAGLPERFVADLDRHAWIDDIGAGNERTPTGVVLPYERREGRGYMRLRDCQARRDATIVTMLCPDTKGGDAKQYEQWRKAVLANGTNLVEIDLLRSGRRPLPRSESPYRILVSRASEFPNMDVWGFGIRDPIPVIPIPLDAETPPVPLALRPSFDRAYDEGRYQRKVRYAEPPEVRLDSEDAAWAAALLAARSR